MTNELTNIIRVDADQALEIHSRALAGDSAALRTYMLWSAWKEISRRKVRHRVKVEVLQSLARSTRFTFAPGDAANG